MLYYIIRSLLWNFFLVEPGGTSLFWGLKVSVLAMRRLVFMYYSAKVGKCNIANLITYSTCGRDRRACYCTVCPVLNYTTHWIIKTPCPKVYHTLNDWDTLYLSIPHTEFLIHPELKYTMHWIFEIPCTKVYHTLNFWNTLLTWLYRTIQQIEFPRPELSRKWQDGQKSYLCKGVSVSFLWNSTIWILQ